MNYFRFESKEPDIFKAVNKGSIEELMLLLDQESIKVNINDCYNGLTPLHVAVEKNFKSAVKLLLEKGASVNVKKHNYGETPLFYAIHKKNIEMFDILIEKTTELEDVETLLRVAVQADFEYALDVLLMKRGKVNIKSAVYSDTPLHVALKSNILNLKIVKKLLDNGPNFEETDYGGKTLLHIAADKCDRKFVYVYTNQDKVVHSYVKNKSIRIRQYVMSTDKLKDFEDKVAIFEFILTNTVNVDLQDKLGQTPLHIALKDNSIFVSKLLARGADVNIKDNQDQTPLHIALYNDYKTNYDHCPNRIAYKYAELQLQSVKELLIKGAEVTHTNKQGETALHHAVNSGKYSKIISELLLSHGADVNAKDCNGQTPLHFVAKKYEFGTMRDNYDEMGTKAVVCEMLVSHGADVNIRDNSGQTPLYVSNGVFEICLKLGAEVTTRDNNGETPLHNAAKRSAIFCKMLLAHGAEVNARDRGGHTPLHFSADSEVCEMLLTHGADVNIRDNEGQTPLHFSANVRHSTVCEKLLLHGADLNVRDSFGETPLHIAAKTGNSGLCKILVNYRANVNVKNGNGQTPLHFASEFRTSTNICEMLLTHGADVNMKDNRGKTPLHIASETRNYRTSEICEVLLTHGADVNLQDNTGKTPLHFANNCHSVFLILINYGAKINIKDNYGVISCGDSNQEIIENHIVMCKCANVHCYIDFEVKMEKFKEFEILCLQDLNQMKTHKVGHHSLISVFSEYSNPTFLSNKELQAKVYSDSLESEFPIYSSLLKATFSKANLRMLLFDEAQCILQLPLPVEMVSEIFSYVDDESLRNVIKASKVV